MPHSPIGVGCQELEKARYAYDTSSLAQPRGSQDLQVKSQAESKASRCQEDRVVARDAHVHQKGTSNFLKMIHLCLRRSIRRTVQQNGLIEPIWGKIFGKYRVIHLLWDLGGLTLDLGVPLSAQFCLGWRILAARQHGGTSYPNPSQQNPGLKPDESPWQCPTSRGSAGWMVFLSTVT